MQVAESVERYGGPVGARVLAIYGGQPMDLQVRALRRGIDVVVATPGRALDHLRRGTVTFDGITTVVLDEADEMLDMGFAEEIEALLTATPAGRQTALFSATMAPRIRAIAGRLPAELEAVVVAGSASLPEAHAAGLLTEYLPTAADLGVTPERWIGFVNDRLRHLAELYAPPAILVGGEPHDGFVAAIENGTVISIPTDSSPYVGMSPRSALTSPTVASLVCGSSANFSFKNAPNTVSRQPVAPHRHVGPSIEMGTWPNSPAVFPWPRTTWPFTTRPTPTPSDTVT